MSKSYFNEVAEMMAASSFMQGIISTDQILAALEKRFTSEQELRGFMRACGEIATQLEPESPRYIVQKLH